MRQVEFENNIVGTAIPAGYIPACEKGFREACNSGALIGFPVEVRSSYRRHDAGTQERTMMSQLQMTAFRTTAIT